MPWRRRSSGSVASTCSSTASAAAAAGSWRRAEDYPEEKWHWIMELNLTSALWPSQAAARRMIAQGQGGSILNISSVRGELALRAGYSSYVAAKGALNMLTKQHATEWAPHGIRVNAISPTFVRTDQVADMLEQQGFYDDARGAYPARADRGARGSHRRGALLLLGRVGVRDGSDPDDGRRVDRVPVRVGVARETAAGERRVALVPDAAVKARPAGIELIVESGAGEGASFLDSAYSEAGFKVVPDAAVLHRRRRRRREDPEALRGGDRAAAATDRCSSPCCSRSSTRTSSRRSPRGA